MFVSALRPVVLALASFSALPALGFGLFGRGSDAEIPWLLFGMQFGLDATTRVFLLFTAVMWTLAGLYARSYLKEDPKEYRFFAFYLVTMTGNLGLIMARDLASFYLFFTLMSFAAYGLVVHEETDRARYAARVYLIMTVIGEIFILPAVLITAATGATDLDTVAAGVAEAPTRDLIVALTLVGFGVKAGALVLHIWLPLAYSAAPIPASAVLSGPMIKAGFLGWIVFLPAGEAALVGWGTLLTAVGLGAAFYGIVLGLIQVQAKIILAYSSISQMGLITVALGTGLVAPQEWSVALAAILVYATHHALVKGTLFLGVGMAYRVDESRNHWQSVLVITGLLLGTLALAGAPLTSGAAAKDYLKSAAELPSAPWPKVLEYLLQAAAVGTTLLMGRFLFFVWPRRGNGRIRPGPGLWVPWAAALCGVAGMVLFLPEPLAGLPGLILSFSALWPVALGALLVVGAWLLNERSGGGLRARLEPQIPEGDLLVPITRALAVLERSWSAYSSRARKRLGEYVEAGASRCRHAFGGLRSVVEELESRMLYWTLAGALAVLLGVALLAFAALA